MKGLIHNIRSATPPLARLAGQAWIPQTAYWQFSPIGLSLHARTNQEKSRAHGSTLFLVGVKGLKPSTSRSQTERAINCATPRYKIDRANVLACAMTNLISFDHKHFFDEEAYLPIR